MSAGRWLAVLAALVVSTFSVVSVVVLDIQIGDQRAELARVRTELAQVQRTDRLTRAGFTQELATERAAFAQAEARIGGTHRDLITCGDWQGLYLSVSGVDSFNGQISASAGPPSLPQHCINQ